MLLLSCKSRRQHNESIHSAYYWSTILDIDSLKAGFIKEHNIRRLYVRYFDVTDDSGSPMPNATLRFRRLPDKGTEIIPTVFITNSCMYGDVSGLAGKILKRVLQMSETNDVRNVREIQIDCDWTMGTRKHFFSFLEELRAIAREKGLGLSATIRLHQLTQPPPPCDRGVLMMYNTGDVTRRDGRNPILDMKDAGPYMRNIAGYALPLSTAYPLFRWEVIFRDGRFVGIRHYDGEYPALSTDTVVVYQADIKDIIGAKEEIDRRRGDANNEIILYDLSNNNIKRLNKTDYEKIFSH